MNLLCKIIFTERYFSRFLHLFFSLFIAKHHKEGKLTLIYIYTRYSVDLKKIAAGQEDRMIIDNKQVELPLYFLDLLDLYEMCLPWTTKRA